MTGFNDFEVLYYRYLLGDKGVFTFPFCSIYK